MEIWKPIAGCAGYEVSNLGRVRSLLKAVKILRPGLASNGYLTVALRGQSRTLHSLVAEAFLGPRPAGMHVRHLDGKKSNYAIENLAYGTPAENRADSDRHGVSPRGSKYRSAKLNEEKARTIRSLKGKVSQAALARRYRVSPAAVQAVHDGRTWTHV